MLPHEFMGRLFIGVVTYNRPETLRETIRRLLANTYPAPVWVQANHDDATERVPRSDRVFCYRGPRPNTSPGHLAADWNALISQAWNTGYDWFLGVQDDTWFDPGWAGIVLPAVQSGKRWIHAPGGDQAFLMHRAVWDAVGPWDALFLGTAHKEFDYILRVCQALPYDQITMEDCHGFQINPIGLRQFWLRSADRGTSAWEAGRGVGGMGAYGRLMAKWPGFDNRYAMLSDEAWVKGLRCAM